MMLRYMIGLYNILIIRINDMIESYIASDL